MFVDQVCLQYETGVWRSVKEVSLSPQSAAAVFGRTASVTVRVGLCEDGTASVLCLPQAVSRLQTRAAEKGLPAPETETLTEAVCRLCDANRERLYDGGRMLLRLSVAAQDAALAAFPVTCAVCACALWFLLEKNTLLPETSLLAMTQGDLPLQHEQAVREGFDGALFIDPVYRKYLLNSSLGGVFFRIGDTVVTPDADSELLRDCCAELMESWSVPVERRPVSADELVKAFAEGRLQEAFVTGFMHAVRGVSAIRLAEGEITLSAGKLTQKLFDALETVERGNYPAAAAWVQRI